MSAMVQNARQSASRSVKRRIDCLQNSLGVLRNIVVPEAKDPIPLRFEPFRPLPIANKARPLAMLRAVNLDNESGRWARKIDDETPNRHLPSEMRAACLDLLQGTPKASLRISRILP
jgi:hypothetical protein